ncbi:GNAT family N-acetyltransferase [Cobetia sp. 3AK]|uniref:GNAT family N-acetyltransferase n=1 Tax=Cobetia sp. 3AK TaxID=3040020 RepID=UPI002449D5BB|nr:GNAT family N-acetyltransferase [Cobetia sp. 3AK]MDH2372962.1 GNAT family N-acetyltransferase [Cobetia sp. 3AK]
MSEHREAGHQESDASRRQIGTETTDRRGANWQLDVLSSISAVTPAEWDALAGKEYPFLQHAYLRALEDSGAACASTGWYPAHLLVRDESGRLVAGLLRYLKLHSRGEYVFDQQWAEALEQAGGRYYPKQLSAVPFTPSAGPRLVLASSETGGPSRRALLAWLWPRLQAGVAPAVDAGGPLRRFEHSGFHLLFADLDECRDWQAVSPQLMLRGGMQYHWQSRGERDFDEWLGSLRSKRRKEIRRERRKVLEQGITLARLSAEAIGESDLEAFHRCYCMTYLERGQRPYLTLAFFQRLRHSMPEQLLLVQARDEHGDPVAAALCLVGADCLYGRWWGSEVQADCLHFEVCYYQGLEFCLERGLTRFDPGTQGEHKISRGFSAYDTWSLHWLVHPGLQSAVADALEEEARWLSGARRQVEAMLPYHQQPDLS